MEPFRLQHRAEDPRELADLLRHKEVMFHEPFDGQIAAARPISHARRNFRLSVEGQTVLRAVADDVEVGADPPEEVFRLREAIVLVLIEHAAPDELAEAVDAEEILRDPEQHVEVAQAALAVLHVGLQEIAGTACAHVALVALAELGGDELGLGAGHQLGEKTPAEPVVESLVAPHVARFEHGGPDRHVFACAPQTIGDRAGCMADGEPQIPHHVEQMLDDLLAAAGQLVWMQEKDIDIGMGRQLAPAVAANRHQRKSVGGGRIRLGVNRACRAIELHAEQKVDQGGLGHDDLGARRSRIEAPAKLLAAIVAGTPQEFEDALSIVSPEPGDRPCESPSVEELLPRFRRVHRCRHGPQAALGRPSPLRNPCAEPGPIALRRAPIWRTPARSQGIAGRGRRGHV